MEPEIKPKDKKARKINSEPDDIEDPYKMHKLQEMYIQKYENILKEDEQKNSEIKEKSES